MTLALMTLLITTSIDHRIDPLLVLSIIKVESNFNAHAVGTSGELGLMQVRPEYYPNVNLLDPAANIVVGIKHLARLRRTCPHKSDSTYVLCYNMGVLGASRVKSARQTKYYRKVMQRMREFKKGTRVIIKDLYGANSEGDGIVLGAGRELANIGKMWVQVTDGPAMYVEKEALSDYNEWAEAAASAAKQEWFKYHLRKA